MADARDEIQRLEREALEAERAGDQERARELWEAYADAVRAASWPGPATSLGRNVPPVEDLER